MAALLGHFHAFSGRAGRSGMLGLALAMLLPGAAAADPYDDFVAFAASAFGAEREPLVYEWFGGILQPPADWWEFVSEGSAAVGFTTNLPARTWVEYGFDDAFDQVTSSTDRHYAVHLHHLTGLRPGQTYRYRAVLEDERGTRMRSPVRTITPATPENVVRIPDGVSGPPYVLDRPGAYYLVTADITAPGTAFEIQADGVTLDLGGHAVAYDVVPRGVAGDWPVYRDYASFGVRSLGPDGFRIVNGTLFQGPAQDAAHPRESIGFNPLFLQEGRDFEVAGLVIEYGGAQMVGLYANYPDGINPVHHNVFVDRGREITDRHGTGSKSMAITGNVLSFHTHHNLVKRTRQSALDGARIHDNEIYIDSQATNSYGIPALVDGREAYDNRIFGTGYHVVGIGWGSENWWHDNFIHLVGQGPDARFAEYGNQESLNGVRLTQYDGSTVRYANNVVEHNLIVIGGGACSDDGNCTQARGIQYSSDPDVVGNVIRDNTIKVVMNGAVTQAAGIVTQGIFERCGTEAPVIYENNRVIANITNVRLGDGYGRGCNHVFTGNRFERAGDRDDYRTFRFAYPVAVVGQRFFDTIYMDGADPDLVAFSDPGQEVTFGWTLEVGVEVDGTPGPEVEVEIRDLQGQLLAAGPADSSGWFSAPLPAYTQGAGGRTMATPTEVIVRAGSLEQTRWLKLEAATRIEVRVGTPAPDEAYRPLHTSISKAEPGSPVGFRWAPALTTAGTLRIHDDQGRALRTLAVAAGSVELTWDGRGPDGSPLAAGTYFAELGGAGTESYCRVILGP